MEVEPWPKDTLKWVSVTSAGFGGTNGHCIIDHVHNMLPSYAKPGVVGQCVKELNGNNGHHYTNSASDTNGHAHANGHVNGINGLSNGTSGSAAQQKNHYPVTNTPTLICKADAGTQQLVVLPFSVHNQALLVANVDALSPVLHQHALADVAYTLAARHSCFMQ